MMKFLSICITSAAYTFGLCAGIEAFSGHQVEADILICATGIWGILAIMLWKETP